MRNPRGFPRLEKKMGLGVAATLGLLAMVLLASCGNEGGGTAKSPSASTSTIGLRATAAATLTGYGWSNATWGGGGYVSGIIYHPSVQGLAYIRTDIGGAYRRDPGSSTWIPLLDSLNRDDTQLMGVESLAVDPNDSQKLYLATGMYLPSWGRTAAILRSSDRGATWARTELPIRLGGNSDGRGTGERLQVDPNLGSTLFLGTNQDGLYKSTDAGVTWNKVASFTPTATTFVLFDKSTGSLGTATQTVYVGVAATTGTTLYRSTDGGNSWSAVPGEPSGLMPMQAALDGLGHLYVTYGNALGPNGITTGAVYKLTVASSSWTNITPSAPNTNTQFGYSGLAVDTLNPNTLVVSTIDRWSVGDDLYRSTDGGSTWTGLNANSTHTAPNNPWVVAYYGGSLAGKMGHWITDVDIDPFDSNSVMYNTGYGIWESHNLTNSAVAWAFDDAGIEETAVTGLASPSSGAQLLMTQGDVGGARYNTSFTDGSGYFPNPNTTNWGIDYAELNPNYVVRTVSSNNTAFISQDNGITWAQVASTPVKGTSDSGKLAVSASGTALLWVPGGQGAYYSTNGGSSWTSSRGYPLSGGVSSGSYFYPVADRAANGYFYTYDFSTGAILESANNGKSFATIYSGLDVLPSYASQSQLLSIPGSVRRDLWLGNPNGLYHIAGATASPVKIANIQAVYSVGYGAPATGQTYPAIYIVGKVNNIYGIFQSTDTGATWTRINDDQHQFNSIGAIAGDPRVFGRVYLAGGGRGVIIGSPQ